MTDDELARLIANDDLGLLAVKPRRTPQSSEEERLLEQFQQIVRFVEANTVPPSSVSPDLAERLLFVRLQSIRSNAEQKALLTPSDQYGLLKDTPPEEQPPTEQSPTSMEDILGSGFLDSLDKTGDEIFQIKHLPAIKSADSPDYIAQRKPCADFHLFEEQFQNCQQELKLEKRRLLPFANEQQIEVGKFYVLRGILLLIAEIGERVEKNGKWNARLRCIFENGTESDMLLRSLASELYKDGRRVTELDSHLLSNLLVTSDDKSSGFIYVLRSLSKNPEITVIPNLHKIGLARRSIETRIQNAQNEPTYLMAPVLMVSNFQCYNVNLPKLENLIHRFFESVTVKVQVTDLEGNYRTPKEWFSVPLDTITIAVRLLISGDIVNYSYNPETGLIVPKR
jgi:hypothetical protein